MPDNTTKLALPYILAAQAQKHVTHNESLRMLDGIVQLAVLNRQETDPPVSPAEGDAYIIGGGATADWQNLSDQVAVFQDGAWMYLSPKEGWRAWIVGESTQTVFTNGGWTQLSTLDGTTAFGAFARTRSVDEELVLSGAQTIAINQIPDRSIVLGMSVRVIVGITGATAFEVGINGETGKFGSQLGINVGDTNVGVIGPTAFYAPTPVSVTATGGDFTAGTIRLVLHTIECGPPLS